MMTNRGEFTHSEILSQPEAWMAALNVLTAQRAAIVQLWQHGHYDHILFTGCGSTYFLSLAAAALLQELNGCTARALPASELWLSPSSSYTREGKTLLVAVSRSASTTETVRTCESFLRDQRGDLVTLTCYPDQPLAQLGMLNIVLPSGQEDSVVQTRAFSTLYLGAVALVALWTGNAVLFDELANLPAAGHRLLDHSAELARSIGADMKFDRFYFLGSGPRYGLACEYALKMKEMSLTHSEPFHFMEFRHGPMSMVTESTAIVGLVSEANCAHEMKVLDEMRERGARIVSIGERNVEVEFRSGLSEAARSVLYLPFAQLIGYERSMAKGFNPDQPHNLTAVVKLA
ncbi:MAG TPA: SIS domain-containing protein [Anaerolineae bacterium]|nr:SIS domain-containing protein [Anaerolineae bacterium]